MYCIYLLTSGCERVALLVIIGWYNGLYHPMSIIWPTAINVIWHDNILRGILLIWYSRRYLTYVIVYNGHLVTIHVWGAYTFKYKCLTHHQIPPLSSGMEPVFIRGECGSSLYPRSAFYFPKDRGENSGARPWYMQSSSYNWIRSQNTIQQQSLKNEYDAVNLYI